MIKMKDYVTSRRPREAYRLNAADSAVAGGNVLLRAAGVCNNALCHRNAGKQGRARDRSRKL